MFPGLRLNHEAEVGYEKKNLVCVCGRVCACVRVHVDACRVCAHQCLANKWKPQVPCTLGAGSWVGLQWIVGWLLIGQKWQSGMQEYAVSTASTQARMFTIRSNGM